MKHIIDSPYYRIEELIDYRWQHSSRNSNLEQGSKFFPFLGCSSIPYGDDLSRTEKPEPQFLNRDFLSDVATCSWFRRTCR